MLSPRTPLLWITALVLLPALTGAGLGQAWSPLAAGLTVLLVLVVLLDAILANRLLRGLRAEFAPLTRMAIDREGGVEVRLCNDSGAARRLLLGLSLPTEFTSKEEALSIGLPVGQPGAAFIWNCTPTRRGEFELDGVYLEAASPFGLWAARRTLTAAGRIKVFPNLMPETKRNAALFLSRGGLGIHARRQIGKGREFEKLRDYVPGDDLQDIHWKAAARHGHPITKVYQVEKTQEVYVVIDTSRLSAKPPPGLGLPLAGRGHKTPFGEATTLERFLTSALVLGLAAERQGDLFGLITFSDRVHSFVRAKGGGAHYQSCLNALYTLQPRLVNPDYDEVCAFIRLRLRRRALVVFLTDIDDPVLAESFAKGLDLISRQHLVMVNMMMPAGAAPLFENPAASLDGLYAQLGGHLLWRRLHELEKELRRRGVRLNFLENEQLSPALISQYLAVKGRQLL